MKKKLLLIIPLVLLMIGCGRKVTTKNTTKDNSSAVTTTNVTTNENTITDNGKENKYTFHAVNDDVEAGFISISPMHQEEFNENEPILLEARAKDGFSFAGWYEGSNLVSSEESYSFNISKDLILTAKWNDNRVSVTVVNENPNAGTVSGYNGWKCPVGTRVSFSAIPKTEYSFYGWFDGENLVSTNPDYYIESVSEDVVLTARWVEKGKFCVTTKNDNSLAGFCSENSSKEYLDGETVYLYAIENTGYTFAGWYNGDTLVISPSDCELNNGYYLYNFEATNNVNYTCKWLGKKCTISCNIDEHSDITNIIGDGEYSFGDEVTLTIDITDPYYSCEGFFKGERVYKYGDTYTFTINNLLYEQMGNSFDIEFDVRLYKSVFTLTVTSEDEEAGGVSGGGDYKCQTYHTIKAIAKDGYEFAGWYVGDKAVSYYPTYNVFMPKNDVTYTAKWWKYYSLDLDVDNSNYGSLVSYSHQLVMNGIDITIEASANSGCKFDGWYSGNSLISTQNPYTFNMPKNNLSYTAVFSLENPLSIFTYRYDGDDLIITGFAEGFEQTEVVIIPDEVTMIDDYAFYNDHYIKKLVLGNGVKKIGDNAFSVSPIEEIVFGTSLEIIGDSVFCEYRKKTVILPSSIKSIGKYAFASPYIETFVFNKEIEHIDDQALCNTIFDLYYLGTEAEWTEKGLSIPWEIAMMGYYVFYYSEEIPDVLEKYWHFVDDKPTIWYVYIYYMLYGGTNDPSNPKSNNFITEDIELKPATKENCIFLGWYTDSAFTEEITVIKKDTFGTIYLYAKYEELGYDVIATIDYPSDCSITGIDGKVQENEIVNITANIGYGYVFNGWLSEDGNLLSTEANYSFTMPNHNVKIHASVSEIRYEVILNPNKGEVEEESVYVAYLKNYTLPIPTRTGCNFVGWFYNDTQITDEFGASITIYNYEDSIELLAKWNGVVEYTLTISKNNNNGTVNIDTYSAYTGEVVNLIAQPNKGYVFEGWYINDSLLSNDSSYDYIMSNCDVTITAKFVIDPMLSIFKYTMTNGIIKITGIIDTTVTSIVIPDYVDEIAYRAFYNCRYLEELTVPFSGNKAMVSNSAADSIAYILSGTKSATGFKGNRVVIKGSTMMLYTPAALNKVTITKETTLKSYSLSGLKIDEVVLPNTLEAINVYAFNYCTITKFEIPNSVTTIANKAFYFAHGAMVISLNSFKNTTNKETFFADIIYSNDKFGKIILKDDYNELYGFKGLNADLVFGNSFKSIYEESLVNHNGSIYFDGTELDYFSIYVNLKKKSSYTLYFKDDFGSVELFGNKYRLFTSITITNDYDINDYMFYGMTSLKTVVFEDCSFNRIGDYAFSGTGIKEISLPNSLTEIGSNAFYLCKSLEKVVLPDNLVVIEENAFYGTSLSTITITKNVTEIESDAFYDCTRLAEVINESNLEIEIGSFDNGYVAFYAVIVISSTTSIDDVKYVTDDGLVFYYNDGYAFLYSYEGTNVNITLPNGITIGDKHFDKYYIRNNAFSNITTKIKTITIPSAVTYIGNNAFMGQNLLETVTFNEGLESICSNAFNGCNSLHIVSLPNSLVMIGSNAFSSVTIDVFNVESLAIIEAESLMSSTITDLYINEALRKVGTKAFYGATITNIHIYKDQELNDDTFVEICDNAFTNATIYNSYLYVDIINWLRFKFDSLNSTIIDKVTNFYVYSSSSNEYTTEINGGYYYNYSSIPTDACFLWISPTEALNKVGNYQFAYFRYSAIILGGAFEIGYAVFYNCPVVSIMMPWAGSTEECVDKYPLGYIFGEGKGVVQTYMIDGSICTTEYKIPQTLTSVTIFDGDVPYGYFSNIPTLERVSIGSGLIFGNMKDLHLTLYEGALMNLPALKRVDINDKELDIQGAFFTNCPNVNRLDYCSSVENWLGMHFDSEEENPLSQGLVLRAAMQIATILKVPSGTKSIGNYQFTGCMSLMEVDLPSSVTSIGTDAFKDCKRLIYVLNQSSLNISVGSTDYGCIAENALLVDTTIPVWEVIYDHTLIGKPVTAMIGETRYFMADFTIDEEGIYTLPETLPYSSGSSKKNYSLYKYAFYKNEYITGITFSNNCIGIGDYAFYGCNKLTIIGAQGAVKSVGDYAFACCENLDYIGLGGVETIGEKIVASCPKLRVIALPFLGRTITDAKKFSYLFGQDKFSDAIKVDYEDYIDGRIISTYVYIPNTLTTIMIEGGNIADKAFLGYNMLSTISLTSIGEVGDSAFKNLNNTSILIYTNRFTYIGSYAFYNCKKLGSITLGNVTKICDYAFYNTAVEYVHITSRNITYIGSHAFANNSKLKNFYLSTNANKIKYCELIFLYDSNLNFYYGSSPSDFESVVYTNSDCNLFKNFTSFYYGDSNGTITYNGNKYKQLLSYTMTSTEIKPYQAINFPGLKALTIPKTLVKIDGPVLMDDCLESIYYNGTYVDWANMTFTKENIICRQANMIYFKNFNNEYYPVTELNITSQGLSGNLLMVNSFAFSDFKCLQRVNIANDVLFVATNSLAIFRYCSNLKDFSYGLHVALGDAPFHEAGLENVYFNSNLKAWASKKYDYLESNPMYYAKNLYFITNSNIYDAMYNGKKYVLAVDIVFESDIEVIEATAFVNCVGIKSLTFKGTPQFGAAAFYGCTNIEKITFYKAYAYNIAYMFGGNNYEGSYAVTSTYPIIEDGQIVYKKLTTYVPNKLSEIIVIEGNIAECGFEGLTSLRIVSIMDGVDNIGKYAFKGCTNLTTFNNYSESLQVIYEQAFVDCKNLTTIFIPRNVTVVGSNAFRGCSKLTIRLQASSVPSLWDPNWNVSSRPVVYNCAY